MMAGSIDIQKQEIALGSAASQARDYVQAAKAPSTRQSYERDWRHFTFWCQTYSLAALPAEPETVALYLAASAQVLKIATLAKRMAALSQVHQAAGYASPTRDILVRTVLAGIRRTKGTAATAKRPILTEDLRQMVSFLTDSLAGRRDRALLLLGFAGGFRRSELVGLDLRDLRFTNDGLIIQLRRSKTDQEGQGREVGIPFGSTLATCPVRATRAWLADLEPGDTEPLFRPVNRHGQMSKRRVTDRVVALVVKRAARAAGLDSADLAGHSLRSGLATSAAAAGVPERAIMAQTGHRSLTTLRKYIRSGSLFLENAAAKVGL